MSTSGRSTDDATAATCPAWRSSQFRAGPHGRAETRGRPAIVVRKTQATATKLTPQRPILFDQGRDRLALSTVEPASDHAEHNLEGGGAITRRSLSHSGPEDVDRVVAQYALLPDIDVLEYICTEGQPSLPR
jgi:hypothetical protein